MNAKSTPSMDLAIAELRTMPLEPRCETLIGIFSMVVAEFATMVLEHCETPPVKPKARRAIKKLQRKIKRRQ